MKSLRERERESGRERERERQGQRQREGWMEGLELENNRRDRQTDRQRQGGRDSNSKTLFYKDCSLGSVKNLTPSPC